jgi:SseB protein N-terminal domain/SseB protein C-terminal domain
MTMPTTPGAHAGLRPDADGRVPRARGVLADSSPAGGPGTASDEAVAHALRAAIADSDRIADLLDVLSHGRLWVPLPDDGTPVTDGSSLTLPTVTYLGRDFVPAFTSSADLVNFMADAEPGVPPPVVPHVVVPAAELARSLPPDLGIALNPGAEASVPVYPEGVAYLAAVPGTAGDVRIRVGQPPREPIRLISEASAQFAGVASVRAARTAWLSVPGRGEGLVISIDLDNPADPAAQDAATLAVERAAAMVAEDTSFPIDVTFPGETPAPDPVADSISATTTPFYVRT